MISQEVLKSFEGKACLVTGGTGLIGRQVVDILSKAGAIVNVASLDYIELNIPNVEYYKVDLRDRDTCLDIVGGQDYVFNLIGIKGNIDVTSKRSATMFVPYLQFNTNMLEACRLKKVKKVVFTSTIGAYSSNDVFVEGEILDGAPMDKSAGWAKRMAELQIQFYKEEYGLNNFIAVRPANVYGPGDNFDPNNAMVIPSLMYKIRRGDNPVTIWGYGSAIRDFAYSRDVAEGIILALYHCPDVPYLNLGSGKGVSIRELVETLNKITNFNYEFDYTKPSGFPKRIMNIDKARQLICYNPTTPLEEGLKETWEWFIKNEQEYKNRKNYFTDEE
ncbi:MAG: NAD-dependent epimerase/dehydratase family protein [Methanogenium sp.]|jgi:GDP-L-fucose synthase